MIRRLISKDMTSEEYKIIHRRNYELEKSDLIEFFHNQKYEEKDLNTFLVSMLEDCYEEELKEDNLL